MDEKNELYFGDNLQMLWLKTHGGAVIPAKAGIHPVNLTYLDPPFNSSATDNVFVEATFRSPLSEAKGRLVAG